MREIQLTNGQVTVVDDADYDTVALHKWKRVNGYAARNDGAQLIYLHRALMQAEGFAMRVDHRNGDRLDNRRANLRSCTHRQNMHNKRKARRMNGRSTTSIYKGVRFHGLSAIRPWGMKIRSKSSIFATEIEAALAYDEKARELFGEFAALNFPREGEQGCRSEEVA